MQNFDTGKSRLHEVLGRAFVHIPNPHRETSLAKIEHYLVDFEVSFLIKTTEIVTVAAGRRFDCQR